MNKIPALPLVLLMVIFFPSCVKDKLTKTYSIYTPVYKAKSAVTANIKTNASRPIKNAGKFFLYGKYLFLNEIDKGIHIIDNSNPTSPKNIGFIDIPGNADLAIKHNILYADFYSELVSIDISNPLQAKLKKIVKNAFPHRSYINGTGFITDSNRIIVEWLRKDTVVDVKAGVTNFYNNCRRCNIMELASFDASGLKANAPAAIGGSMARFAVVNSTLYSVDNNALKVFSVSKPEEPVYTNQVSIGWGIETLFPFKDKLFIGSNTGMFIFDITNGSAPQKVGQFTHARVCDPVIADDDFAFVTLRTGTNCAGTNVNINQLDVVNISNLTTPYLVKSYTLTNPYGLSKDGNLLFICDGSEGLKIFDASNVNNIKLIKQFEGFESYDVIAYNDIAMVVGKSGIRQFDYSNPADIKYLSTISW